MKKTAHGFVIVFAVFWTTPLVASDAALLIGLQKQLLVDDYIIATQIEGHNTELSARSKREFREFGGEKAYQGSEVVAVLPDRIATCFV